MKNLYKKTLYYFFLYILSFFVLPAHTYAELSSANYTVVSPLLSTYQITTGATSTNYTNDQNNSLIYVYDVTVSGGGGSGGSTPDPTPDPDPDLDPIPDPDPDPDPAPDPDPEPTPDPDPTPDPTPDPDPDPTPDPDPEDGGGDGEGSGDGNGEDSGSGGGAGGDSSTKTEDDTVVEKVTKTVADVSKKIADSVVIKSVENITAKAVSYVPEPAKKVVSDVVEVITSEEVIEPINTISTSRPVKTTAVTSGALLSLFSLVRVPFSLSNTARAVAHVWSSLFGFVVYSRRRRSWGTIYDSKTKAPLDPAYVELFDNEGNKIDDAITDLDGRYGFVAPPGEYTMYVRKSNYTFPSKKKLLDNQDILYANPYYGDAMQVSDSVARDVPMDPVDFDWNQYEKMRTKQTRFIHKFDPVIMSMLTILFYLGVVLAVWQVFYAPTILSFILLAIYAVLLILRFSKGGPVLFGRIQHGNSPSPFAIVRVLQGEQTVISKVTDENGRYVAIVPPGNYTLRVEEPVSEDVYKTVLEKPVKAKRGMINEIITLK